MSLSKTISELESRGLIQDVSDRDGICRLGSEQSFYIGYDPTAPSLQLGNLVPVIVSIHLAKGGLKAIQLFGGATGAIGDPSGKSAERQLLSREAIDANVESHKNTVTRIFERVGVKAQFVNNYTWTKDLSVLDFLRDIGKHFTVNYMLAKEVVKTRLEGEGLSFTEFSYMLLQSYDFLQLYEHFNCRLQIGGSDQWGNITAGLELIRKKGLADAYALSIPLVTDSQGKKFGKTEGGAIWLNARMTSPYRFHQFWLNVDDADVIKYLKIFTFLGLDDIQQLQTEMQKAPEKREAQKALADAVCDLVHGPEATAVAKKGAKVLFGESFEGIAPEELLEIFRDVPSSSMPKSQLSKHDVLDVFVATRLVKSKSEARRLIASGGAYVNNNRLSDPDQNFQSFENSGAVIVLRAGKKNYHLLKLLEG